MNPLVKKEIRLLLPALLIGCGLGLANEFLDRYRFIGWLSTVPVLICLAMAVMIALNSFGTEIGTGTFTLLLAQPVTRQKIWQTKITLLAVALLILGFAWFAPIYLRLRLFNFNDDLGHLWDAFEWMLLAFLVIFSGSLWTVLLLRQVAAAFWFTVLVPGVIWVIFSSFMDGDNDSFIEGFLVIALGIYSVAGFFFARWLFMRAQDVQWSGGAIVMPEMRGTPAWLSSLTAWRVTHPNTALWRKEIQLQQSQFLMAFMLVVLHLGVLATRKLGHFNRNSGLELILESFWFLWLVMPCLVGCAAIAEERKLGTHESQLCLPVKRNTQFAIKLSVVVLLSVFFGVAMPLLFEGGRIFPEGFSAPLFMMMGFTAGIGGVSFFVSSQARNTLQALAPAVAYLVFFRFWMIAAQVNGQESNYDPLWRGDLVYLIGITIALLTLLALACRNFRLVSVGWKTWTYDFLIVSASLFMAATLTTVLYHRPWDRFTPFEPPHGPARLALTDAASLSQYGDRDLVRLPDGRIWSSSWSMTFPNPGAVMFGDFKIKGLPGVYLSGSSWKMVKEVDWEENRELMGIKDDGTLWVSEKPWSTLGLDHRKFEAMMNMQRHLVQFGNETNWTDFQPVNSYVFLTKTDGTLWRWGPAKLDWHEQWPGFMAYTPERVGTESNWTGFVHARYAWFLRKTDGSLWVEDDNSQILEQTKELDLGEGMMVYPIAGPIPGEIRSAADVRLYLHGEFAVFNDGTLRMVAQQEFVPYKGSKYEVYPKWEGANLQMDHGSNWVAVASSRQSMVTLKDDGTLWQWNFHRNFWWSSVAEVLDNSTPVRLGTHSDWIAIASGNGYVLSLAADGSLWYWPMEDSRNADHMPAISFDYSRKPQLLGNVFAPSATLKAIE